MKRVLLLLILSVSSLAATYGQNKAHLIGFKYAYNISGMDFNPKQDAFSVKTNKNYSLVYTYYHDLWKSMPYFGFQAAISYQDQGFVLDNEELRMKVIEVPIVSQFHVDFWKMRLLLNLGGFVGYRLEKSIKNNLTNIQLESGFNKFDNRADLGFIVGGGLAFKLKPIEIQLECNYQYSLSYLYHPKKFSEIDQQFTYPKQLLFSIGILYQLTK